MAAVWLYVGKLDGSEVASFELDASVSVLELKTRLEKISSVPPDRQRLVHKETNILSCGMSLRDSHVKDGDSILMIVTPENHLIFAAYKDRCARLWVAETGECLVTLEAHQDHLRSATVSSDGLLAATTSDDGTCKLWNLKRGECLHILDHTSRVHCAAFSPHSNNVVTACEDGSAMMWNVETGTPVCFSTKDSTFVWIAKHPAAVQFISWGVSSIVTAAGEEAFLWSPNLPTYNRPLQTFKGHTGLITSAFLSVDDRWLLTASKDCCARIWNARHGNCTERLVGHESPLNCAAFTADGSKVLTAGGVLCMLFWAATGDCLQVFSGHCGVVSWVAFSSDDAVAVSASHDGSIRLWDVSEGECLQSFTTDNDSAPTRRAQGAISACFCA